MRFAIYDSLDHALRGVRAIHTIPFRPEPVTYAVAVTPSVVCPGGQVQMAVRIKNWSSERVIVQPGLIIAIGGGRYYGPSGAKLP